MPGVGTVSHHRSGKNAVEEEGSFYSKTNSCRRRVWLLPRLTRSAHAVASNPGLSSATPASDCRAGNSPALHYAPSPPTELTANLNPCDFINTARLLLYLLQMPTNPHHFTSAQLTSPHLTKTVQQQLVYNTRRDNKIPQNKDNVTTSTKNTTSFPRSFPIARTLHKHTHTHPCLSAEPLNRRT
jgi:hypothetical protein